MWKIALGATLAATLLHAQPRSPLLLPAARHIVGIVDENGNPVEGASIDHTGSRAPHLTEPQGKLDLWIDAPAFVIRKAGYQGLFVHTEDAAGTGIPSIRFTLRRSAARLRTCSGGEISDDVYGYRISFEFRTVPGVRTKSFRDVDYSGEYHYVDTANGPQGIQHGSGPMWSFGQPLDDYVWKSAKYEDVSYRAGRTTVIDARGQYANGSRRRFLGTFGETAVYDDVDDKTAALLNRVLDGACLAVSQP